MDWALAMKRNRDDLVRALTALFVTVGVASGALVSTLPRHIYRAAWAVLRPAEAALRRLIVVEAREITVAARPKQAAPDVAIPRGAGTKLPAFRLFDPRKPLVPAKRYAGGRAGIWFFDGDDPVRPVKNPVTDDDPVDAGRLARRLLTLQRALDDIPAQARRLARLRASRSAKAEPLQQRAVNPMRPGRPPGFRARRRHPVDEVLAECHALALLTLAPP